MGFWKGWCFALLMMAGHIAYGINALPSHAIFYKSLPDGGFNPYIELYWQVDPKSIEFGRDAKEIWTGKIITQLEVRDDTGIVAREKYLLQTPPASSLSAAQLQNIMDLQRYTVKPGMVKIRLMLSQEGKEKTYYYNDSFQVAAIEKTAYSSILLLDTAYKTEVQSPFVKNGQLRIPLSINFLDDYRKWMHYHIEAYDADKVPQAELPLVQHTYISKKEYDYSVYGLSNTDTITKPGAIQDISGSFKIDVLPSGNYYLNFVLKNAKGQDLSRNNLFFQRSNINPASMIDTSTSDSTKPLFEKVTVFDVSSTFVGKYTIAQLKAILKMLKPIATPMELLNIEGFSSRPDEMYMRYFIYNFWQNRVPGDAERGWDEYTTKVKEVNKLFGSASKPGYESERGFIHLKYGAPEQRFVVSSEQGALPYEVWVYNAPGRQGSQGAFLFFNPGFMGQEYRLLHSTVIGEFRNMNWRAELYRNGAPSNNNNSRAEQTFPYR